MDKISILYNKTIIGHIVNPLPLFVIYSCCYINLL
jgi:hypothetical protein